MKKITDKKRLRIKLFNLNLRTNTVYRKGNSGRSISLGKLNTLWIDENVIGNGVGFDILNETNNSVMITLPERMNFSDNNEQTVLVIQSIRRLVSLMLESQRGKVKNAYKLKNVNFDKLNKLSTSAGLVLAAELSWWNDNVKYKLTPMCDGWNPAIKTQLTELGFFDLFGLPSPSVDDSISTVKSIKYFKGKNGQAEKARQLRSDIEIIIGDKLDKRTFLYSGISEAITNVSGHAYPKGRLSQKDWYMTGAFDKNSRELKVVFYDQGIGIPNSLPKSMLWERAKSFLSSYGLINDHPSLIKAAVEMGRTKTDEKYRGKGLKDLLTFIDKRENGYLSILSLKGLYKYQKEGKVITVKTVKMNQSIPGTLIIWSVILEDS